MDRTRIAVLSAVAAAALAVAACGSVAPPGNVGASPASTVPPKLVLAAAPEVGSAAAPSADAAMPAIRPAQPTRYVLDAALPDLGSTAVVWTMRAHAVARADVDAFAAALGLGGTPSESADGWQVQGAKGTLFFDLSGGAVRVSYTSGTPVAVGGSGSTGSGGVVPPVGVVTNGGPMKIAPPAPPVAGHAPPPVPAIVLPQPAPPVDVPSASDAETTARALLDHLGVLAGQEWSTTVADSGGVAIACAPGTACPDTRPQVSARTVTFSLTLGGTRVDGIDWSVTLGSHAVVESLNGEWASAEPDGSYPLRSPTAVFADLQHGTARYIGPQAMIPLGLAPNAGAAAHTVPSEPLASPAMPTVTVHITGVALGVTRWDAYEHDQSVVDLVPTYRFHSRTDGGVNGDIEVLALDPRAATFTTPGPIPVPKPGSTKPMPPDVPPVTPAPPGQLKPATSAP